jgi:hypothetical protein
MKQKLVSGLGILLVFPAFAGARLPVVNMSAGSVSARAQYGVPVQTVPGVKKNSELVASNTATTRTVKKHVVARGTTNTATSKKSGEKIAVADYLKPNRPSTDLWAKNDTPLRMPRADEFSVVTSNVTLPEEKITASTFAQNEISELSNQVSSLDAQIARLMDMQRRAEESTRTAARATSRVEPVSVYTPETTVSKPSTDIVMSRESDNDVKISRVIVPRDETGDVIVRNARTSGETQIQEVREDMTKMSPAELRRAFRKTFLSENKHLSTYPIDNRFDVASDLTSSIEGFTSARDLSEDYERIRPLEIKITFRNADSALSRDNYNLLSEYAGIVVANPKRAIQVAIPVSSTETSDARKLAARRLAIVEQVLRDTGVAEQRIVPVLSERNDEGFVLRIISNEQYETLTRQTRNKYGRAVESKTYKNMTW